MLEEAAVYKTRINYHSGKRNIPTTSEEPMEKEPYDELVNRIKTPGEKHLLWVIKSRSNLLYKLSHSAAVYD